MNIHLMNVNSLKIYKKIKKQIQKKKLKRKSMYNIGNNIIKNMKKIIYIGD